MPIRNSKLKINFKVGSKDYELLINVEEINPKVAAEYLKCRRPQRTGKNGRTVKSNRKPSDKWVISLAEAMEAGEFAFNGDFIRFSIQGYLIDGQHRLLAVIKSGETIKTLVMRGLPLSVIDCCDRTRIRTIPQDLEIQGYQHSGDIANALQLIYTELTMSGKICLRKQPRSIVAQRLLKKTPQLHNSLNFCLPLKNGLRDTKIVFSKAIWAHYRMSSVSPEIADSFWTRVSDGTGLDANDPALQLRNKLIRNILDKGRANGLQLTTQAKDALLIKACIAAIGGKSIKVLRYISSQEFPTFPWDQKGNKILAELDSKGSDT